MTWEKNLLAGETAYRIGNYTDAAKSLSLALAEAEQARDDDKLTKSLLEIGRTYYTQGRYNEAMENLLKARDIAAQDKGKESPQYATVLNRQGWCLTIDHKFDEAEPLLRQALEIRKRALGGDHPDVAESLNDLGCCLMGQTKFKEAEPLLSQALGIREKVLGRQNADYGASLNNLSVLFSLRENFTLADVLARRSLEVRESCLGKDHPEVAQTLLNWGTQYLRRRNFKRSEAYLRRAMEIFERTLPAEHHWLAVTFNSLASCYLHMWRFPLAKTYFEKAQAIAELAPDRDRGALFASTFGIGLSLMGQKDPKGAEPFFERSLHLLTEAQKTVGADKGMLDTLFFCYLWQGKVSSAIHLMPDSMRASQDARFHGYVNIVSKLADLANEYGPWKKDES